MRQETEDGLVAKYAMDVNDNRKVFYAASKKEGCLELI